MRPQANQHYIALTTGSIISTSYDTGPYRILILSGPWYTRQDISCVYIWPRPVISIVCADQIPRPHQKPRESYLNDYSFDHEYGCWISDQGDVLNVHEYAPRHPRSLELLDPAPYSFQAGIDYSRSRYAWHCATCKQDFNAENTVSAPPRCPTCTGVWTIVRQIIMMPETRPGERNWSSYQRSLGFFATPDTMFPIR